MTAVSKTLNELIEPVVTGMGYELVGVEYLPNTRGSLLRVYIDNEPGINLGDCEAVSHQLSGVLDVEDPIPGQYRLEISSPGLDRPLFKSADYERFAGATIKVRLAGMWQGRRKFKGELLGVRDGNVLLRENGDEVEIPLAQIEKSNLVPEF